MARVVMAAVMAIIVKLPPVAQVANGRVKEAQMEARDTNRVEARTMIQTANIISKAYGTSATSTPAEVSMPLPPLKRSQQVKLWPRMADKPAMISNHSREVASAGVPKIAMQRRGMSATAASPFKASAKSTNPPA